MQIEAVLGVLEQSFIGLIIMDGHLAAVMPGQTLAAMVFVIAHSMIIVK